MGSHAHTWPEAYVAAVTAEEPGMGSGLARCDGPGRTLSSPKFGEGSGAKRIAVGGAARFPMLVGGCRRALRRVRSSQLEIKEPKVEAGEIELEYVGDYHFGQPRRRFFAEPSGSLVADDTISAVSATLWNSATA